MRHEKKTFDRSEVALDDNEYIGCTFNSCTFVFAAKGPFTLNGNSISADCRFVFTGGAADTINAMRAIYSMGEWGRNHVMATFQQIAPDLKKLN